MSSLSDFAEPIEAIDSTHVLWRGRKLIYFGGCDYLRLSRHPKIIRAVKMGLERHGFVGMRRADW